MAKIFLAHANQDKPQVRKLYADLKTRGFDPWLDEIDLVPGQIWKVEIPKAIRQAQIFLACLSSQSVEKVGYVQNEFRLALSALGARPSGTIFLIPVRFDECDVPDLQVPDLGLSLRDIHWVDLWQDGGFDRLVQAIEIGLAKPNEAQKPGPAENVALPLGRAIDQAPVYIPDQKVSEGTPETPPAKPAPEPRAQRRGAPLWQNPTIIAGFVGAIGAVAAALSPWLLEKISDGDGRNDQVTQVTPPAAHVEKTSPDAPPRPVPMTTVTDEPFRDCEYCPLMVAVPSGSFIMGSTEADRQWAVGQGALEERLQNEKPQHRVQITEPFAVGKYEVTFAEWDACVADGGCNGYNPDAALCGRGRKPVIHVSREDAQAYVAWLSNETGQPYRLLSEAEWEYAARAGTTTSYSWGDGISAQNANYGGIQGCTTEVGQYSRNPWGLYDMHGNVWEWVEDCWNDSYQGAPSDGSAWASGDCSRGVFRGGSWDSRFWWLRSSYRFGSSAVNRLNDVGFRVARTIR